jgi:hypothetical protein
MSVKQTLEVLGAKRVIWIDDWFMDDPEGLASTLVRQLEVSLQADLPQLHALLKKVDAHEDAFHELAQAIADMPPAGRAAVRGAFLKMEAQLNKQLLTPDLNGSQVDTVCTLLEVAEDDRWSFEGVEEKLSEVCKGGDSDVVYVVDLNDAGDAQDYRGLELLKFLSGAASKGTAFLLTHAAQINTEADLELKLRQTVSDEEFERAPVCVIAKERLLPDDQTLIEEGLRVALKRAGLRRGVHQVLLRARAEMYRAFDKAANLLLEVPPEQLDQFVVNKGYTEGLSELHVVERALSAQIGHSLREVFAADGVAQESTTRLRRLREVSLKTDATQAHPNLAKFRTMEIWESEELINSTFSPLAPGDVFELDSNEGPGSQRMFVLIGQPCDVALRHTGKRDAEAAFLVPLKPKAELPVHDDKLKEPFLPFKLKEVYWACDLRNTAAVRLRILDLCSFRSDGRVRFDAGQTVPAALLPGVEKKAGESLLLMTKLFAAAKEASKTAIPEHFKGMVASQLQLTLSETGFNGVRSGVFKQASQLGVVALPERLVWSLRRYGRIRDPYPGWLLSVYLNVVGRGAFAVDFTAPPKADAQQAAV